MAMTISSSAITTGIRSIRCSSPKGIMHRPVERTLGGYARTAGRPPSQIRVMSG